VFVQGSQDGVAQAIWPGVILRPREAVVRSNGLDSPVRQPRRQHAQSGILGTGVVTSEVIAAIHSGRSS
jgi:hypothetical protein